MPIEFRCTQCGKLLQTADGTAGKTAKCPQCGKLQTIPELVTLAAGEAGGQTPTAAPLPPPAEAADDNPYQPPVAAEMRAPQQPGEIHRGFNPTRIDVGDVMGKAWEIYKSRFWPLVGTCFVVAVLTNVAEAAIYVGQGGDSAAAWPVRCLSMIVWVFLTLGLLSYLLKVARGEDTAVADVFSGGPLLLPGLGVWILLLIAAAIGFVLCFIPGIVVFLMFSPAMLMLIDQHTDVLDSFRYSMQATRGNRLTLFALALLSLALLVLGFLACFVGCFFVVPYIWLLYVVSYLGMTGQGTVAD